MKPQIIVIGLVLASLAVLGSVNVAFAQWSAINSEQHCAVSTNYHGEYVPIDPPTLVTATAGTLNTAVNYVEFRWRDPDGNEIVPWTVIVAVAELSTPNVPPDVPEELTDWANEMPVGTVYWYAQVSQTPNISGDWGVQARFLTLDHVEEGKNSDIIAARATSFFELPEIPFGTLAILISTLGVLTGFGLRKRYFHK